MSSGFPTRCQARRPSRRRVLRGMAIGSAAVGIQTVKLNPALAASEGGTGGTTGGGGAVVLPPVDTRLAVRFDRAQARRGILLRRVNWTAFLLQASDGAPVVGATVTIAIAGETLVSGASDVTNSNGRALATAVASNVVPIGAAYTITFAGNSSHKPTSVSGTVS